MSQNNPTPADPHQEASPDAAQELFKKGMSAFGSLVENITPWLVEFGSWL